MFVYKVHVPYLSNVQALELLLNLVQICRLSFSFGRGPFNEKIVWIRMMLNKELDHLHNHYFAIPITLGVFLLDIESLAMKLAQRASRRISRSHTVNYDRSVIMSTFYAFATAWQVININLHMHVCINIFWMKQWKLLVLITFLFTPLNFHSTFSSSVYLYVSIILREL